MRDEHEKVPIVEIERPEGVMRVAFVDGAEVVVSSDSFIVNRVEHSVRVRFKREGDAWVDARDTYIRRSGMRRDDFPSHSARTKIWAAAELVLREALEADPRILTRATAARLRRDIDSQTVLLRQAEARAAEIRRGVVALKEELAAVLLTSGHPDAGCDPDCVSCQAGDHDECGVGCHEDEPPKPPPLIPEQCPGCGKLGDDCICGLDVDSAGPEEPEEGDDQSAVPMAHELADDERWPYLESADFWREAQA